MNNTMWFCQWLSRLAWLNVVGIIFSFSSGIVLGIMPALIMMCTGIRWYVEGERVSVAMLWRVYCSVWARANKLWLLLVVPLMCTMWYWHWAVVNQLDFLSVFGLAIIPFAIGVTIVILCLAIQISMYETVGIKDDLNNAFYFFSKHHWQVILGLVAILFLSLMSLAFPLIALFYLLTPGLVIAMKNQSTLSNQSDDA
ncbi:DUF624 domain-containing protein [Vibrio gangliei]|uniref:DUF624 domain-containing protein n=1 Tax=Vibrio gangliei TaxID=2077090 RepID=UPI000D01BCB8|nr:DUF624 domain-containing protein [Vibrio gangliei]